jgi:hypothetical protein
MQMTKRTMISFLATTAVVPVALVLGLQSSASAVDSTGCNRAATVYASGTSLGNPIVKGNITGSSCSFKSRDVRAELKRQFTGRPDPLVAGANYYGTVGNWSYTVSACEPDYREFYSRNIVNGGSYKDSEHKGFTNCK